MSPYEKLENHLHKKVSNLRAFDRHMEAFEIRIPVQVIQHYKKHFNTQNKLGRGQRVPLPKTSGRVEKTCMLPFMSAD